MSQSAVNPFLLSSPDVVSWDDLDALGAECTSELQVLEQDVYHLLIEELGSNPDDPNRGIGIESYLSGTEVDFMQLPALIDAQLRDDDRITDSATSITLNDDGTYEVDINIMVSGTVYTLPYAYANGVFSRGSQLSPLTPTST
jgi:hypothetical protein